MKSIEIKGKKRKETGKFSTILLRKSGLVPCVLYGKSESPIHFFIENKNFKSLVYTSKVYTVVIDLDNNIKIKAILQDIQYHPVSDIILHADFYKLSDKRLLIMEIPVVLIGRSPGIIAGGLLQLNMRKLRLKALPKDLPDEVVINISQLNIGDKIYVKQIKEEYNYMLLHSDNCVIVSIKMSRVVSKNNAINKVEDEKK